MATRPCRSILASIICQIITGLLLSVQATRRHIVIGEPSVKTQPIQELGPGSTAIQYPCSSVFRLTLYITPSTTLFSFRYLPPIIYSIRHQNNDGKARVIDQTLVLKLTQDKLLCHFGHRMGLSTFSELWYPFRALIQPSRVMCPRGDLRLAAPHVPEL